MPRSLRAALLLAVALLLAARVPPAPAAASAASRVDYRAPVDAPVSDPFRPPVTPFGPGNRGLELDTEPGAAVGAAAAGTVTFAGPVAGAHHVTVLHADRLRTTYGPLASVAVVAGDVVGAGQPVGTAGERLLWTARLGDAYLDPAVLLAASGAPRVRLVPNAGDAGEPGAAPPGTVHPDAADWALEEP